MQMPIRQPLGMRTPAPSAASRIGVAPSASTSRPSAKVTVPPSPGSTQHRAEPLGGEREAAVGVVLLERVEQAGRAAGVGEPLGQVGHQLVEVVDVEDAVAVVVPLDQP